MGRRPAPENTLPAYVLAKTSGFNFVETDIQWTSDGVPVLLHDDSINRTARNADGSSISGTVNIRDITYAQALEYDFGIWKSSDYAGTKIPTFTDFIALCRNLSLHPYIELKTNITQNEAGTLLNIIYKHGMRYNVSFISASARLRTIKNKDPYVRLGVLWADLSVSNVLDMQSLQTGSNEVFANSVDTTELINNDEAITRLINSGIPLEVFTFNESEAKIKALNPYVTGYTADILNIEDVLYNSEVITENE